MADGKPDADLMNWVSMSSLFFSIASSLPYSKNHETMTDLAVVLLIFRYVHVVQNLDFNA